jgi:hypothetical protein
MIGWVFNTTPLPFYPRERAAMSIAQEAGWSPEPVWTGEEKTNSIEFNKINNKLMQL